VSEICVDALLLKFMYAPKPAFEFIHVPHASNLVLLL